MELEKCHQFMENAKQILDSVTYGLEDAKIQIMQMIGLWLLIQMQLVLL